ncbi:putative rab geranylgeranyl transferase escort protein [Drepanopeziza brunnea f. sp. 'multigermtubi' MB_m1]|uniref:Rab proteins geranylgeranyltransferase n=1 Tax=Marssonina brunnea f. sp. multigermtubi (strain MB_m1) TaxID=1072389 RepID=K1XRN7_MARBU|nr:putative rab geranylgeranyl transferase escort protein [Drepanopeziza brunnea f. sp. 'multigermtubi' MB_m1]EKD15259.1 putative rab geranylgeranyl transferase escort protein [Drepanopeziza brunnea f. sp. 'multigermtubi' MB_m1]
MESLSQTKWDVVISGTGLQHSLLALALSRSNKKILHVDPNEYYGGAEAAFSLQEVDEWVEKVNQDPSKPFRNASLWKPAVESPNESKLSFSRAYSLTLSPQIIYTRSKLLSQLVASKVYRHLEFQAVGNWWIFDGQDGAPLKRLPNGREDIFQDKNIDNRAKRSLMRFLKFVVDYENQTEVWQSHSDSGLAGFLSSQFQLPPNLQIVIAALTLSLDPPDIIPVKWALPRVSRHLSSLGVFGPGFGAVVAKWGGGAEISQVACRAGAVGGGIYVLGTGVTSYKISSDEERTEVHLSNHEVVKTKHLVQAPDSPSLDAKLVSKVVAVVSSPLTSLFRSSVEGSPLAAVSVVLFPPSSLAVEGVSQPNPVHLMVHSSETGECPNGQCVIYGTTLHSDDSKSHLETALATFLKSAEEGGDALYILYYEQEQTFKSSGELSEASIDLAFNDEMLEEVETQWKSVIEEADMSSFMRFEDREGINEYDDEDVEEF